MSTDSALFIRGEEEVWYSWDTDGQDAQMIKAIGMTLFTTASLKTGWWWLSGISNIRMCLCCRHFRSRGETHTRRKPFRKLFPLACDWVCFIRLNCLPKSPAKAFRVSADCISGFHQGEGGLYPDRVALGGTWSWIMGKLFWSGVRGVCVGEAHVSRTSKHLENAPWLQPAICHLFQKLLGLCELQCDFKGFLSHWLMPVKPLLVVAELLPRWFHK